MHVVEVNRNKTPKILFLTLFFEPEKTAMTHLYNDLIEGFIHNGYIVEVYTPIPSRNISNTTRINYSTMYYQELYNGKLIIHRYNLGKERDGLLNRIFRYMKSSLLLYKEAKKSKEASAIYAASSPPTMPLIAGKLAKKMGIPFIYNLQDIFPDSLINAGKTKEKSLICKIGRIIEKKSYKSATKIITISKGFANNLRNKGISSDKIIVIDNWIDTNKVVSVSKENNPLFDKYSISRDDFIISYCGNIGLSQNFELVIKIAKRLKDNKKIKFIFIGEGAYKNKFMEDIKTNNIDNIIVLPFQDYSEISNVYSLGDVGLVISKPGVGISSVPSKTWSIMSASRPVLASFDLNSDLTNLISDIGCGYSISPEDESKLYDTIIHMQKMNKESLAEMGRKGRQYVERNLDKNNCVQEYIDVFNNSIRIKV